MKFVASITYLSKLLQCVFHRCASLLPSLLCPLCVNTRSVLAFLGERPHPIQGQSNKVMAEESGGPTSSQGQKNRPWGKRQQQQQHNAVAIRELLTGGGDEEFGFNMDLTFELKALEICLDEVRI
jgi:hypothetical protein